MYIITAYVNILSNNVLYTHVILYFINIVTFNLTLYFITYSINIKYSLKLYFIFKLLYEVIYV